MTFQGSSCLHLPSPRRSARITAGLCIQLLHGPWGLEFWPSCLHVSIFTLEPSLLALLLSFLIKATLTGGGVSAWHQWPEKPSMSS